MPVKLFAHSKDRRCCEQACSLNGGWRLVGGLSGVDHAAPLSAPAALTRESTSNAMRRSSLAPGHTLRRHVYQAKPRSPARREQRSERYNVVVPIRSTTESCPTFCRQLASDASVRRPEPFQAFSWKIAGVPDTRVRESVHSSPEGHDGGWSGHCGQIRVDHTRAAVLRFGAREAEMILARNDVGCMPDCFHHGVDREPLHFVLWGQRDLRVPSAAPKLTTLRYATHGGSRSSWMR
jgi:hypothetical protein